MKLPIGFCILAVALAKQTFSSSLCELEAESGFCRGYFPRYFFNKASGKCEQFIYGGCGGNENNFETLAACHDSCAASAANAVCVENEEFTYGTACPLTCDNIDNPPKICTLQGVIGCQCQKGYVRNAEGKCVLPEQCPSRAVCGENEEFTKYGTACPLTCNNIGNPPKICTLQGVIGCQCQKGYVRSVEGKCVLPEQCPSRGLDEFCLAEQDSGSCDGSFKRWYYDAQTEKCRKFVYGGCKGNKNRYEKKKECDKRCKGVKSQRRTT